MAMNCVPGENIYIGGIFSLKNQRALEKANITHVLSVLRLYHVDQTFAPFHHHQIEVDDVGDENLLEHLPSAVRFIQSGLDAGGGVLVHCAMGKSRSAAVCIAYWLHRQPESTTPESALALLRECRPLCEPNEGFMEQLTLYHQMGCPDDVTAHPLYSRWLYHREVEESVACGRAPESNAVLFEDERLQKVDDEGSTEIKCRKCRRNLATSSYIIPHKPGKQQNNKTASSSSTECAHIFLHALTWMRPSLFPSSSEPSPNNNNNNNNNNNSYDSSPPSSFSPEEEAPLSGRLTCPNRTCGSNIGKFAWAGLQCSCGRWVVPAMGLAKARVDVVQRVQQRPGLARLPPAAMGIRLPPGMRSGGDDDLAGSGTGRGNL